MQTPEDDEAPPPTIGERFSRFLGVVSGDPNARAELDMARVLEELKALGAEPVEDLTVDEARRQPTLTDAINSLLAKAGATPSHSDVAAHDVTYPGAESDLPARIYRPPGGGAGLPVVLFFHGGGFVLNDIDDYDATPRAICARTGALVVAAGYRQAPEHKFPAAHDDALEAYRWLVEDPEGLGGDVSRIAIMGESAGGNLALNAAVAARDEGLPKPAHLVLLYPLVGVDMTTPSYRINEFARPLNKATLGWFLGHVVLGAQEREDPRLDVIGRAELSGLPSTTIVTAEIDPLRSEGAALAERLRESGVAVDHLDCEGVTHGFFGLTDVVRQARAAQEAVARDLDAAFARHERSARAGRAL